MTLAVEADFSLRSERFVKEKENCIFRDSQKGKGDDMRKEEWMAKKKREEELEEMDRRWRRYGGASWQLFPPSYYYKYSEEEIRQMTEERMKRIRELIDELE